MTHRPTQPQPSRDGLPHALTFFLTVGERREVLRALRGRDPDRRTALLRALGVEPGESARAR